MKKLLILILVLPACGPSSKTEKDDFAHNARSNQIRFQFTKNWCQCERNVKMNSHIAVAYPCKELLDSGIYFTPRRD